MAKGWIHVPPVEVRIGRTGVVVGGGWCSLVVFLSLQKDIIFLCVVKNIIYFVIGIKHELA